MRRSGLPNSSLNQPRPFFSLDALVTPHPFLFPPGGWQILISLLHDAA
jgi:hypothetical protein